jgi:hypothetical protein
MKLSPRAAHALQQGPAEKRRVADRLMNGEFNVADYTSGVCYETVALVRHLLGAPVPLSDITSLEGNAFAGRLQFMQGRIWDGGSIERGTAVGFYRLADNKIFHAAIAIGGTRIRAVNGFMLGPSWMQEVDLRSVLKDPDANGIYKYDGTKIRVYLSKTYVSAPH